VNIVFAGTPAFAVPALRALFDGGYAIAGVFTQPDRPAGRGRRARASAIKTLAHELHLPVYQPQRLTSQAVADLNALAPDVFVVAAYGLLLPPQILAVPRYGCINVHASLLPRWRGAAPIARAIEAGDRVSGVTIMQMDAGLDTGPILAQRETAISDDETAGTLHDRLATLGAELLLATLALLARGELRQQPQDETLACYAPKIAKAEALVDWARPAIELRRKIRAFNPWPIAYTRFRGQRLRIFEADLPQSEERQPRDVAPGTIVGVAPGAIRVCTGAGVLAITRLQLAGAAVLSAAAFIHGQHVQIGERLG
jgi:methionyl-tRNA formyltransferase